MNFVYFAATAADTAVDIHMRLQTCTQLWLSVYHFCASAPLPEVSVAWAHCIESHAPRMCAMLPWLLTLSCTDLLQVYSFGVTVWQIMERKRPFEGLEPYQVGPSCNVN